MSYRDYEQNPLYQPVLQALQSSGLKGHPRYYELLAIAAVTHHTKNHDYAGHEDPLANLRCTEEDGIPAWQGTWVRAKDKIARFRRWFKARVRNEPYELLVKDETAAESLVDLANYCLLETILVEELS